MLNFGRSITSRIILGIISVIDSIISSWKKFPILIIVTLFLFIEIYDYCKLWKSSQIFETNYPNWTIMPDHCPTKDEYETLSAKAYSFSTMSKFYYEEFDKGKLSKQQIYDYLRFEEKRWKDFQAILDAKKMGYQQ